MTSERPILSLENYQVVRTLSGAADGASVPAEGHGLLLLADVLEEGDGAGQLPAVDSLSGLTGVLERNPEVGAAGAGGLARLDLGGGVANLQIWKFIISPVFLRCTHCRIVNRGLRGGPKSSSKAWSWGCAPRVRTRSSGIGRLQQHWRNVEIPCPSRIAKVPFSSRRLNDDDGAERLAASNVPSLLCLVWRWIAGIWSLGVVS